MLKLNTETNGTGFKLLKYQNNSKLNPAWFQNLSESAVTKFLIQHYPFIFHNKYILLLYTLNLHTEHNQNNFKTWQTLLYES